MDFYENTPLLSSDHSIDIKVEKGRCWCCWETSETKKNPLIRVCLGCKDPDLQYIHQECVNNYLTCLPTSSSNHKDYYCTRCRDPYIVSEVQVHPLLVIWKEKGIAIALLISFISVLSISAGCLYLLVEFWGTGQLLVDMPLVHIPITGFAVAMLITTHIVNYLMWAVVLDYYSGRTRKIVRPIDLLY